MRLLAQMAHQICNENGRRLLIFTDWPLTQWFVEMVLQTLGFNVLGIRALNKPWERLSATNEFTDPDSNLQILVTSLRISSH